MKKILLFSAAFAAFTVAATAQTKQWNNSDSTHHRPMHGERNASDSSHHGNRGSGDFKGGQRGGSDDQAIKDLGLTKKQQAQWKKIHDASKTKLNAIKDNTSISPADKGTQMKAIMEDQKTQVESILTAEQKTKWNASQQNKKGPGRQKPRDVPAGTTN